MLEFSEQPEADLMESAEYQRMSSAEDHMWWYRALHANLLAALRRDPGPPGSVLLDAGCGTGGLLRRMAEGGIHRHRIGIDAEAHAAAMAAAKSGAAIAVASVDDLPFADASLGAIISADVLYHRRVDPERAVAESIRCLMPGGVLIVNVPAYDWMSSFHDRQVHGARRFTRTSLRRLLAGAGFARIDATYWNTFLFPLMVLHRKLAGPHRDESDVGAYPPLLEALFLAVTAVERGALRIGLRYPFGGSVLAIALK